MYKLMTTKNGQLVFVFDEDAADEMLDFQNEAADCMDTIMDALRELKDLICSLPVPNTESFPKPKVISCDLSTQNDLPL